MMFCGKHQGYIPSVVARGGGVLFVGTVVFFVDDDEPKGVVGKKKGGACSEQNMPVFTEIFGEFAASQRAE